MAPRQGFAKVAKSAYFHENNMYAYTLTLNSHLKKWYTPIQAFFANVLFLFWNPFTET